MKAGGSKIAVWEPIAAELNRRLPEVNKIIIAKKPEDNGKLKKRVTAEDCKSKFDAMQEEYRKACACDSSTHAYLECMNVYSYELVACSCIQHDTESICRRRRMHSTCTSFCMQNYLLFNQAAEGSKWKGHWR
jgi:hypothetical protein